LHAIRWRVPRFKLLNENPENQEKTKILKTKNLKTAQVKRVRPRRKLAC
jgi:hypothetical protein